MYYCKCSESSNYKIGVRLRFQLFKRSHRRIILTEEGIQLFHTLQHSLKLLNKEIFEIRNQEISGTLTIYARPSLAQSWLIPAIAGFNQKISLYYTEYFDWQ